MDYELREYERDNSQLRRERSQAHMSSSQPQKQKIGDLMTGVIVTQCIVFSLILLIFLFFYKTQSDTFTKINAFYNTVMQKDMTAREIADCVKSVLAFVSQPQQEKPLNDNSEEALPQGNTDEQTQELTGAGGEDLLYVDGSSASFAPVVFSFNMVKPVEYTRVTSPFGYRINPVTNEYGFHSGIDLAARTGTPIKAAFDGTVTKASYSNARGNYIFLESSGNITTVYCHCSELIAQQGANVRAGEVIAKVGSTGQSTGPHLHFEIRIGDVRHNPAWVLDT